jgi:2-dehydropantoate 2-reductase
MGEPNSMASGQASDPPLVLAGAGAMGCGLAALLSASGTATTLFARPRTARDLIEHGGLGLDGVAAGRIPAAAGPGAPGVLGVVADPAEFPDRCGIVFATKGPQLAECVATVTTGLAHAGRSARWVAGLQNGVLKDDVLAAGFGAGAVLRMVSTLNARVESARRVVVSGWGHTYVGATGGEPGDADRFAAALGAAGAPATALSAERADAVIWTKCVNAVGVFGVSALTRLPTNVAFARPELVDAYLSLAAEAAGVARANGVVLADFEGLPMNSRLSAERGAAVATIVADTMALGPQAPSYSSMAQDVIAGRPTEVHQVLGDLVDRAAAAGVSVPLMRFAYALIAGQAQNPGTQPARGGMDDAVVHAT